MVLGVKRIFAVEQVSAAANTGWLAATGEGVLASYEIRDYLK